MDSPAQQQTSIEEGRRLLQGLIGLRLSEASISDEGFLAAEFGTVWSGRGQISLRIESRWRASRRRKVLTGSADKPQAAARQLGKLIDLPIEQIDLGIEIHDLLITLADGHRLASFTDGPGNPLWGLAINDAKLLRGAIELPENAQPWLGIRGTKVEIEFTYDDDNLIVIDF
jgi:hypothetical protein